LTVISNEGQKSGRGGARTFTIINESRRYALALDGRGVAAFSEVNLPFSMVPYRLLKDPN
jgi:hypothetical protein